MARAHKQQLDVVLQQSQSELERIKLKYIKMHTQLEKLFQLERDQQVEMQRAELVEQNKQVRRLTLTQPMSKRHF